MRGREQKQKQKKDWVVDTKQSTVDNHNRRKMFKWKKQRDGKGAEKTKSKKNKNKNKIT